MFLGLQGFYPRGSPPALESPIVSGSGRSLPSLDVLQGSTPVVDGGLHRKRLFRDISTGVRGRRRGVEDQVDNPGGTERTDTGRGPLGSVSPFALCTPEAQKIRPAPRFGPPASPSSRFRGEVQVWETLTPTVGQGTRRLRPLLRSPHTRASFGTHDSYRSAEGLGVKEMDTPTKGFRRSRHHSGSCL